ncbi:MAG: 23S rRNA (adenine(2503)-C(2))-methyltransferase RlmN [Pseudomonadota bacterium]
MDTPATQPAPQPAVKSGYLNLARDDWDGFFKTQGVPKFRATQASDWVFKHLAATTGEKTNLSKDLRATLDQSFDWNLPEVVSALNSQDGSTKLLLKTANGQLIESVILRYEGRVSLCVSSQVGCKMACSFCQTGKLGFFRNLTTHEIIAQYLIAARIVRAEGRRLSHVVFMGMGEPLDNYANVVKSVNMLVSPDGFGLSARHVTVSTSGVVPKIRELAKDARCALAISLHAARDDLRTELMPINRKWDLADLKASLLDYQRETNDKITFEYIMIRDKNCGLREAKDLMKFLHGFKAKVNLIPFNSHPGMPHQRPSDDDIRAFQVYLAERSIAAPVRYSKGLDVSGACGQLAAKTQDSLHMAPSRKSVVASSTELPV